MKLTLSQTGNFVVCVYYLYIYINEQDVEECLHGLWDVGWAGPEKNWLLSITYYADGMPFILRRIGAHVSEVICEKWRHDYQRETKDTTCYILLCIYFFVLLMFTAFKFMWRCIQNHHLRHPSASFIIAYMWLWINVFLRVDWTPWLLWTSCHLPLHYISNYITLLQNNKVSVNIF